MSEIIGEGEARRFYETAVAVQQDDGWAIELDGRVVKTPKKATFLAPAEPLAKAVAEEWNAQGDRVVPASMPLTSLCNAAIDRVAPDVDTFKDQLIGYAKSDLLCYWAEGPDDLVLRQSQEWQPVLDWAAEALGAHFSTTAGIIPIDQPNSALAVVSRELEGLCPYHVTGLVDLAGRLNSLLLAMAFWKGKLDSEQVFAAAFLDELFQEEQWGEDREAMQRRALIREEMMSTARFLTLLDET